MTSANEDTPKKLKSKKDPSRFLPPGLYFRGKFIGIEHVADACGDRSDMMCQVAMAKMKAAIKTLGDHKRRIIINISINGIKILDEKDEEVMFDHPLPRISYISRDISDSRAFGYVFNPGLDCHEFYGIKTEKAAEVIVSSLSDLFQFVFSSHGKPFLPEDSSQHDESRRAPSPPYSLRYGGIGEGGTLGRFRKSPRLLYRFYNTVSNVPAVNTGSPRKQTGFLTLYNRQSSVPTNPQPQTTTSPTAPTIHDSLANSAPFKTPSLSSSSSSNQNVNNSPSATAMKSPMSVVASKKSLSSISSLPVIESPPNSPDTFKPPSPTSQTSPRAVKGPLNNNVNDDEDDDGGNDDGVDANRSAVKTPNGFQFNISEDSQMEKQIASVETPVESTSESTQVIEAVEVFNGTGGTNQADWANFEEFEFSDGESPVESGRTLHEVPAPLTREEISLCQPTGEEKAFIPSQSQEALSAFETSHLTLSFNGIDPFVDDPFFSKDVGISFDSFKFEEDNLEFSPTPSSQGRDPPGQRDRRGAGETERESREDFDFTVGGKLEETEDKFFEDDFVPELTCLEEGKEEEEEETLQDEAKEASRSPVPNGDQVENLSTESVVGEPVSNRDEPRCIHVLPEIPRNLLLPSVSLKSLMSLKPSIACDFSPTSPSTNPSEFPSPDIPPPPLPPEVSSPLHPTPPPLPPRRPQWQKVHDDAGDDPITSSTEEDMVPLVPGLAQNSQDKRDEDASPGKPRRLDTASILKLYSVPATSYFSLLNSAAACSIADEEPTYGNLHSVLTDVVLNPNPGGSPFQARTSDECSSLAPPPDVPDRRLSPTYLSFQSFPTGSSSMHDHGTEKEKSVWMGI